MNWRVVSSSRMMDISGTSFRATTVGHLAESGKAARRNYASSALLVFYFYHLDGRGDARHTANFLKALQPRGQNLQASAQHLLRDRTYAELEEDFGLALRREGLKISWAAP